MPRILRIPGTDVLPAGPKREFVKELHVYFRLARRVPLARIAAVADRLKDAEPVSRETIRRLLVGEGLSNWAKVEAVLRALCELAGHDPDQRRWPESEDRFDEDDPTSCREHLYRLWSDALDDIGPEEKWIIPPPTFNPEPTPASGGWGGTPSPSASGGWGGASAPSGDPWAPRQPPPAPGGGYSDEPPF